MSGHLQFTFKLFYPGQQLSCVVSQLVMPLLNQQLILQMQVCHCNTHCHAICNTHCNAHCKTCNTHCKTRNRHCKTSSPCCRCVVCCSVLQCGAVCCSVLQVYIRGCHPICQDCCIVLQCVATCYNVLQRAADVNQNLHLHMSRLSHFGAGVVQCFSVWFSVSHCVATWYRCSAVCCRCILECQAIHNIYDIW